MTATAPARFRYIGTTDECVDCQRPGCTKTDLQSTVIIVPLDADGNDDGEATFYGSTCAARALAVPGGGTAVRKAAEGARLRTLMNAHDAARMLRFYGLPLAGEMTEDQRRAAVRVYVQHNNTGNMAPGERVSDRVRDMLARKQAAITEAVMVAGTDWKNDRQPLEYGYASVVKDAWS